MKKKKWKFILAVCVVWKLLCVDELTIEGFSGSLPLMVVVIGQHPASGGVNVLWNLWLL